MGLMYVFPVSEEETDFVNVDKKDRTLTLKTYGLPYIFWIYALCSTLVILLMFLAVKEPVLKLIKLGDQTDATLGYALLTFIGLLPLFIFSFFFYEKRITKKDQNLGLIHKIFGLTFFSEMFLLENSKSMWIESFLSSPNMARLQSAENNQGFQNKGYFTLWLIDHKGQKIQIDRHSRKSDLEKLKAILEDH